MSSLDGIRPNLFLLEVGLIEVFTTSAAGLGMRIKTYHRYMIVSDFISLTQQLPVNLTVVIDWVD